MSRELEDLIVEALAEVYMSIPWAKMRTRHSAWDIFNHRVRAASRKRNISEAFSKLANYFGLQSLPTTVIAAIEQLRQYGDDVVLNKIYSEHVVISMKAIMRATELKKQRRS